MDKKEWLKKAKTLLKLELVKEDITYAGLAERLAGIGVDETEASIKNKVSRGAFSAVFFLQCLKVLNVRSLDLNDL